MTKRAILLIAARTCVTIAGRRRVAIAQSARPARLYR